ncbi:FH2 domain-containing protein 1-like [Saccostrea cucullata]|uniref:FH2 domain-containing protein 1-like n=1 Tax=Saccostrea cuccullata TaxID=36930 RepID=UPI002ED1A871
MNTKSSTNIPKMTFLHYLVETSEQRNQGALEFVKTLQEPLENASRFLMNGVIDEFNQLRGMIKRLKQNCEQTDDEVKTQYTDFLEKADAQMDEADDIKERMREQSTRLAQYFCENEMNFNPDEFLDAFKHFCENIRTCQLV